MSPAGLINSVQWGDPLQHLDNLSEQRSCDETMTAEFTRNPDAEFPAQSMKDIIVECVGDDAIKILEDIIADRKAYLTKYQDAAYAERYESLVRRVQHAERPVDSKRLATVAARNYFMLMARLESTEPQPVKLHDPQAA